MRKDNRGFGRLIVCVLFLALLAAPGLVSAADMGHGSMSGMKAGDHGKMGDKISSGTIARWQFEARLMDMKAHMEMGKTTGMKMDGMKMDGMKSHHLALYLSDPASKMPVLVSKGTGSVTVTGLDKKTETSKFTVTAGYFGADVNLPKPGKYTFNAEIEAGGTKGSATFSYTVK